MNMMRLLSILLIIPSFSLEQTNSPQSEYMYELLIPDTLTSLYKNIQYIIIEDSTFRKDISSNTVTITTRIYNKKGLITFYSIVGNYRGDNRSVTFNRNEDGSVRVFRGGLETQEYYVQDYNERGELVSQIIINPPYPMNSNQRYEYFHEGGHLIKLISYNKSEKSGEEKMGEVITYHYDNDFLSKEVNEEDVLKSVTEYEPDSITGKVKRKIRRTYIENELTGFTDQLYEYDDKGMKIRSVTIDDDDFMGYSDYHYQYDDNGYMISEISKDKEGNILSENKHKYDKNKILYKRTWDDNVMEALFVFEYDNFGRITKEVEYEYIINEKGERVREKDKTRYVRYLSFVD